jgi:hypothetical protein
VRRVTAGRIESEDGLSKRRKLIEVSTTVTGDGDGRRWGCRSSLPMSSADAVDAENAAVRIMQAVNAQLDFSKSDLRLVAYDLKLKAIQKVEIPA